MSVHTTTVITTAAVCDNLECSTVHQATDVADLAGLLLLEATLLWKGEKVVVKDVYACKGSCASKALLGAAETEANRYW